MSRERSRVCGIPMFAAALCLTTISSTLLPGGAAAQRAFPLGEAIREAVIGALPEAASGRVAVRVRASLGEVSDLDALIEHATAPTLEALRGDRRLRGAERARVDGLDTAAAESAHRAGFSLLVDVELAREDERVVALISVFGTAPPRQVATARVVHVPDVSLRRHLGFPAALTESTVRARALRMPSRGYLAIAAQDLDGDGRAELIAVRDDRVEVMRLSEEDGAPRLTVVGHREWPTVSRAPSMRRRPVAVLAPLPGGVLAQLSDWSSQFRVSLVDGSVRAEVAVGRCGLGWYVVEGRCGRLVEGRDFFDHNLSSGSDTVDVGSHFYALREVRYEARDGHVAEFRAVVSPVGRLTVRVHRTLFGADGRESEHRDHARSAPGFGDALAVADLDLDGSAEILASSATPAGHGDHLRLVRAFDRGALRAFWRSDPLDGSVFAACAGDVDGDGLSEMLAVEELANGRSRLWVVR